MNVGKEIDGLIESIEEAKAEADHPGAQAVALQLVERLQQLCDEPADLIEEFYMEKRSLASVFGKEARAERLEMSGE